MFIFDRECALVLAIPGEGKLDNKAMLLPQAASYPFAPEVHLSRGGTLFKAEAPK